MGNSFLRQSSGYNESFGKFIGISVKDQQVPFCLCNKRLIRHLSLILYVEITVYHG